MEGENEIVEGVKDAIGERDAIILDQSALVSEVIEDAQRRVNEVQEQAAEIVEAAMETNLGREISELKEDHRTWQEKVTSMSSSLEAMQQQMTELGAAIAVLAAPMQSPPVEQSLSIPPALETLPEEVTAVIPEPLQSVAEESPVPQVPEARKSLRRWI